MATRTDTLTCAECDTETEFEVELQQDEFNDWYEFVGTPKCPKCGCEEFSEYYADGRSEREDFHADI